MVVLAQLSPKHGFQIKWALEFPGAPLGAIEYILTHVIKKLGDAGVKTATFGAGATGKLQAVEGEDQEEGGRGRRRAAMRGESDHDVMNG